MLLLQLWQREIGIFSSESVQTRFFKMAVTFFIFNVMQQIFFPNVRMLWWNNVQSFKSWSCICRCFKVTHAYFHPITACYPKDAVFKNVKYWPEICLMTIVMLIMPQKVVFWDDGCMCYKIMKKLHGIVEYPF